MGSPKFVYDHYRLLVTFGGGLPNLSSALWCQYPTERPLGKTKNHITVVVHCGSKNVPTLADYNYDPVQSILIIFSKLFVNDHKSCLLVKFFTSPYICCHSTVSTLWSTMVYFALITLLIAKKCANFGSQKLHAMRLTDTIVSCKRFVRPVGQTVERNQICLILRPSVWPVGRSVYTIRSSDRPVRATGWSDDRNV